MAEPFQAREPSPPQPPGSLPAAGAAALGPRTLVPPEIPGYALASVIGRGSTGTVWRARQLAVDREVALKVLHPELSARPRVIQRLQREARTTARLAHPSLVSAIDMGETGGRWWFAMELVDGPSLAGLLRQKGALSEREALRLFIPLAEALDHLWEHGVVHRDIKPGNILIDKSGLARLADLGLAFAGDDPGLTRSGATLGTPHYVSPEQARDPSSADIRSDIWSFGATLFHVLCGRPPFAGESVAEVLSAVLYAAIPDPRELAPELTGGACLVLRKCLARDPLRRYQTPRELLSDLERVRERRKPRAAARGLDPLAGELSREARLALVAGAGVLLAAVLTLAWLRPWSQGAAPLPYAPLEALAVELSGDPRLLAGVMLRLDALEPEVPMSERSRWRALRLEARERLRAEFGELLARGAAAAAQAAAAGDHARAQRSLATELEAELAARTGYTPDELPRDLALELALARTRERENESRAHTAAMEAVSAYVAQEIAPFAFWLVDQGRWRDALEFLNRSPERVAAEAGLGAAVFTPGRAAELRARAAAALAAPRGEIQRGWAELDRELEELVVKQADELARRAPADPEASASALEGAAHGPLSLALELRLAARAALSDRRLSSDQVPEAPRAHAVALERRAAELLAADASARRPGADSDAAAAQELLLDWLDEAECAPLWDNRRAEQIMELWNARVGELAGAGPAAAEALRGARSRAREAELVAELLGRAATGIRASEGTRVELRVGSIVTAGTISGARDPLAESFGLRLDGGGELVLALVGSVATATAGAAGTPLLEPRAVEAFAGVSTDPASLADPLERLRLGVWRRRSGDLEGARAVLGSGPLPGAGIDGDLARRLWSER